MSDALLKSYQTYIWWSFFEKRRQQFPEKSSVIDFQQGSKYTSEYGFYDNGFDQKLCPSGEIDCNKF